jgi:hypothetical protein
LTKRSHDELVDKLSWMWRLFCCVSVRFQLPVFCEGVLEDTDVASTTANRE